MTPPKAASLVGIFLLGSGHATPVTPPAANAALAAADGSHHGQHHQRPLRASELIEFEFGGEARTALLYIPAGAIGAAGVPLVFNYHGYTGSGQQQETSSRMSILADTEGFAAIYPDGVGLIGGLIRSHNGGSCCDRANNRQSPTDDVGFAEALVERVGERLELLGSSLDLGRIYSTGMSNGGFMSIRLGCEDTSLFAAVGSVTGVLGNEDPGADEFPCDLESSSGRPIPYFHIHGTADSVVPYEGNGGGFKSVADTVATYRELNSCGGDSVPGFINGPVSCESWCGNDINNVTLCTIEAGAHVWFGPNCNGPGCEEMDSTKLMWEFFKRHRREPDGL